MQMNGIQGGNAGAGQVKAAQATDAVSKNIRNQISNLQKQIQNLSSNEDMGVEEKMKKRQELKQQIAELQNQLRQHEMEQKREVRQESSTSMEEMLGGSMQEEPAGQEGVSVSFSEAGMQAMISADSALSEAKKQGSVAKSLKGRAAILKTEIKLDAAHEASTGKKREELATIEQRAMQATVSQVSILSSAVNEMKEGTSQDAEDSEPAEQDAELAVAEKSMAEKYNPVDILL